MIKLRFLATILLFIGSFWLFSSAFAIQENKPNDASLTPGKAAGQLASVAASAPEGKSQAVNPSPGFGRGLRLMSSFTVFLLAVFVGFEVINKVPPTLHTPLMSGSNAISGITIVGALLVAGHGKGGFGVFLGMIAVLLAFINVVGGFLVTHRMLLMFKKR